jgi:hypothetical protein
MDRTAVRINQNLGGDSTLSLAHNEGLAHDVEEKDTDRTGVKINKNLGGGSNLACESGVREFVSTDITSVRVQQAPGGDSTLSLAHGECLGAKDIASTLSAADSTEGEDRTLNVNHDSTDTLGKTPLLTLTSYPINP